MSNIADKQWYKGKPIFNQPKVCRYCDLADEREYLGGSGKKPTFIHKDCVAEEFAKLTAPSPAAKRAVVTGKPMRGAKRRSPVGASSLYCGCAMCRSGRESLCLKEGD